jgi:glutaredoxin
MQPENAAPADSITPVERTVLMYSRPGCGLCDEARRVILGVREGTPFRYEEVDISGDDALELEYGIRIPVVLVDGEERFEVRVDAAELAFAVRG